MRHLDARRGSDLILTDDKTSLWAGKCEKMLQELLTTREEGDITAHATTPYSKPDIGWANNLLSAFWQQQQQQKKQQRTKTWF